MNAISLVTDVASVVLPIVPAGVSHAIRAAKIANKLANTADMAADTIKAVNKVDDVVDVAKKVPVVIGENMKRVKDYAKKIGGEVYNPKIIEDYIPAIHDPISLKENKQWIKKMIDEGREIIDIGPDFITNRPVKGPSRWYELERKILKQTGYGNYRKDFVRFHKKIGGVSGFDIFID